jgi:hypothetical protein
MTECSWQAPEFDRLERTAQWYMWTLGITAGCVIVSILQSNLLFGIFAILAEVILLLLGRDKPRQRVYTVTSEGIYANEHQLRSLKEVSGFAVHDMGGRFLELVFQPVRTRMHTYTRLLIPRERVEEATRFLNQYIPMFEYEGGLFDVIVRYLGI